MVDETVGRCGVGNRETVGAAGVVEGAAGAAGVVDGAAGQAGRDETVGSAGAPKVGALGAGGRTSADERALASC